MKNHSYIQNSELLELTNMIIINDCSDYKYDLGNERPICSWYDFMKVNYDATRMQILETKKEEVN